MTGVESGENRTEGEVRSSRLQRCQSNPVEKEAEGGQGVGRVEGRRVSGRYLGQRP